jgi:hydrogenase-4 component B
VIFLLNVLLVGYTAGIILPLCFSGRPVVQNHIAHGLAAFNSVIGSAVGLTGLLSQASFTLSIPSSLPFLNFAIRLDPLAAFFVLTISLVGLAASVYAIGYTTEFYGRVSIGVLGSLFNGFLLMMTLVVLADNGFFFLLAWELMSLVSYFLVVTEHEKTEVRYAGFFYLIMTHVGTAFIILTFLILYQQGGSFSFDAFRHPMQPLPESLRTMVFLGALIGFGTKAGIVPLHIWLPYAHPAAPSHVSALMSGVMIKIALYGLLRIYFDFLGGEFPWWWGFTVLSIGAVSALLGVLYALMEHDLKSLLAFSSVENIGIILLGIGAGMVFQSFGLGQLAALALIAALYHTINHALLKGLLFLGAGALLFATHTRNVEEYGGLLRRMPWTGLFFLIGSVSIAALPPMNGFISEWLVFQSLFLSFKLPAVFLKLALPIAAAMLALTAVLGLVCFAKAFGISFLALPRSTHAREACEVPMGMRIGMGALAVLCVLLGLGPMIVVPVLDHISGSLLASTMPAYLMAMNGWVVSPGGLDFSSVSPTALAGMLITFMLLGWVIALVLGGRLRKRAYKTWGCGLNLSPRMEYSATGFVQPIKRVFSTIYQPTIRLETEFVEESRYFAKRKQFEFHIEPLFQRYLYDPVVALFSLTANRLRFIQAGSLHLYLAYIFVTLVLLLLLAL